MEAQTVNTLPPVAADHDPVRRATSEYAIGAKRRRFPDASRQDADSLRT
jgi:hypothetical protein